MKKEKKVNRQKITCPACHSHFILLQDAPALYCPNCKASLQEMTPTISTTERESHSFISGHLPSQDQIQFTIGPYQILQGIGTGGMGEVFQAYDTICGRKIALKRIRPDLTAHPNLYRRFLKEAHITSQLTHPAIIPIYSIKDEAGLSYYTMPYVEGETLRQILTHAREREKKGLRQDHISSIPALLRIFLSICQAVAYAHSKGVVHRDLKPNNIIVGRYGEVLILDWGLAKLISQEEIETEDEFVLEEAPVLHEETRQGKVVGTVAYIAPERALGMPATFQTDVYSLGVILYQLLTLHYPFHRKSLEEFRKNMADEVLYDPAELAPYREVAPALSRIALNCLSPSTEDRYKNVEDLIHDLESYLEGRSEWIQSAELNVNQKSDWEFQENVLVAEHMAITRGTDVYDWVILMISEASFTGNTRIEARVRIGENGHGIGFLLSVPEAIEREHPNSGYCLWIASDLNKTTKVLRSAVEVLSAPEIYLQRDQWYRVRIEKIENNIHFYLNDVLQFSYISHLPLRGTHVGLMARDADFTLENFSVSVGSQNITINCLAVPDAFLAHEDFPAALSEYRRIAYAFPGTAEARESMFRAGITLLEESKDISDPQLKIAKSEEALEEFGLLRGTPGAPLEYLGKALVYQASGEYEEEVKCFELALRRYPKHHLLPLIQEQLIYRMYDSSRTNRPATYQFVLLAVRHLPATSIVPNVKRLFNSLKNNWETLPFIINEEPATESFKNSNFAIQLAFWQARPHVLNEILNELTIAENPDITMISNALFSLIELGAYDLADEKLKAFEEHVQKKFPEIDLITKAIQYHSHAIEISSIFDQLPKPLGKHEVRLIFHLLDYELQQERTSAIHSLYPQLINHMEDRLALDCLEIWALLLDRNWQAAGELLHHYPFEQLAQESSLLYILYGCWLYVTEGKEIASIHFYSVLDVPYPRSWTLLSHFYHKSPEAWQPWLQKSFLWERRQLFRQLALYAHCTGNEAQAKEYLGLSLQQFMV